MGVVKYALLTYALTAVISFAVIGLIVFVNYLMNYKTNQKQATASNAEGEV